MFKLNLLEMLIIVIPETFVLNFIIYTLSKKRVIKYKYITVSFVLSFCIYISRLLPALFGMHIIINIILTIIAFTIIGIPFIKAVRNTLIAFIILQLCELVNIVICFILDIQISNHSNIYIKALHGIPSLILFILSAFILKFCIEMNSKKY